MMKKLSLPDARFRPTDKLIGPDLAHVVGYKGRHEATKESVFIWRLINASENELALLERLRHQPKFLELQEKFAHEKATFLITEGPCAGSLAEYVRTNGPLSEPCIRTIMNQLLDAADFLQRQRLAHLAFDVDNVFVEAAGNGEDLVVKVNLLGLVSHNCKFCGELSHSKSSEDSFYTTDYCKHIRDLSLSLLTILLQLLRGRKKRQTVLLSESEVAQDEYRRESEALANELMLKAFCGNVEYSVDAEVRFPFKSLQAFRHHHFSPRSLSPTSLCSAESADETKSIASAPNVAAPESQQTGTSFQRAPSEAFQSRTPSRTGRSHGVGRSAASLKSARSSKSVRSAKSMRSGKSGKSEYGAAAAWPLPSFPVTEARVCRVTEYGRFIYEANRGAIFEYTNGTGLVQGVCEVTRQGEKQKVRLFKPVKPCPLPTMPDDLVARVHEAEKEFDSIKKLDSVAICLYHMICNDMEAFLSHTPAWILRCPFALKNFVGGIMHNGDVHLTFADTGFIYWRKCGATDIVPMNNGPDLSDEELDVFEATALLLEAHRCAWEQHRFIRTLKRDLMCNLSVPGPIFPLMVMPQPQTIAFNPDEKYRKSLEEFYHTASTFRYGNALPSTSQNGVH